MNKWVLIQLDKENKLTKFSILFQYCIITVRIFKIQLSNLMVTSVLMISKFSVMSMQFCNYCTYLSTCLSPVCTKTLQDRVYWQSMIECPVKYALTSMSTSYQIHCSMVFISLVELPVGFL